MCRIKEGVGVSHAKAQNSRRTLQQKADASQKSIGTKGLL